MEERNAKGPTTAFSIFTPFRSWSARFARWLVSRASPRATHTHSSAYTFPSSSQRTALRLRAELDELIAVTHRDPTQFLEGYCRAAQLARGEFAGSRNSDTKTSDS